MDLLFVETQKFPKNVSLLLCSSWDFHGVFPAERFGKGGARSWDQGVILPFRGVTSERRKHEG